jgi:hypothetical protein
LLASFGLGHSHDKQTVSDFGFWDVHTEHFHFVFWLANMLPHPSETGGSVVDDDVLSEVDVEPTLLRSDVEILPTVFMAIHHVGDDAPPPPPPSDGIAVDDGDMLLSLKAQNSLSCPTRNEKRKEILCYSLLAQ